MEKRRKIRGDDPNLNRMKKPKGYRAIEINGREMFWMTDGFVVIIKDDRKSIEITTSELMGYSRNPIERHIVTPYDIKSYVDENWSQFA